MTKPFKCNECDYRCKDYASLNKHIDVHIGEKPSETQFPPIYYSATNETPNAILDCTKKGAWDFDEIARKHFIDSLINADGFSMPFKNGKELRVKDIMKTRSASPHPSKNKKNTGMIGAGRDSALSIQNRKYNATVFATRFKPGASASSVKRELEADLLRLTGKFHAVIVDKLSPKYDH